MQRICSSLRGTDIHVLLEAEKEVNKKTRSKFLELFTVPRNRRAMQASSLLVFMYVPSPFPLRPLSLIRNVEMRKADDA